MFGKQEFLVQGSNNRIQHSRKMRQNWTNIICGVGIVLIMMVCMWYVLDENKNLKMEMKYLRLSLEERIKRSLKNEEQGDIQSQLNSKVQQRRYKRNPAEGPRSITTKGAAYYRWGRRDCSGPNNVLVYHGIAAGSYYSHPGGPSNILCIHMNVSYENGRFMNAFQGGSRIYGMEYQDSWISNIMNMSLTEDNSIQYHSVPCALCLARSRGTQVMIVAQSQCPHGWMKEYTGFIMSGNHDDKHSSEAICVDDTPQVVPGTSGQQHGVHLHMIEIGCTSLLCEPFVRGRELRCVVCTI